MNNPKEYMTLRIKLNYLSSQENCHKL